LQGPGEETLTITPRLDLDDGYCVGLVEDELRRLVNQERAQHGLAPVVHSKLLGQTATLWAHYTAETGVVAHVINGRKWSESIRASTYPNTWLGQVLAGGQPTPVEVVAAWMASATHRAVVLDERWAALGVALVEAPEARYVRFWAANFGAVADDPPPHCLEHAPRTGCTLREDTARSATDRLCRTPPDRLDEHGAGAPAVGTRHSTPSVACVTGRVRYGAPDPS